MKTIYILGIVLGLIAGNISGLYADDAIRTGDMDITPYAEIKVQYDDNVFLTPSDESEDVIVTLTPGVALEKLFSDNSLKMDYHVDINRYMDYDSQDAVNHYASGELELNLRDVSFNIYDRFSRAYERPSVEESSRLKKDDNTAGILARVQRERLGIELGYENFTRNYRSDDYRQFDRMDHIYSFKLIHSTFPKTDLLFEYDYGQVRYDESTHSDSDYHQYLVGAIGDITAKTTVGIKTGYKNRDYEKDSDSDFDAWVIYGDITHRFSERDALYISLARTAEESTYSTNNYYKVESVSAVLDHFFTRKLLGFISGNYQINSYPNETTEDGETDKRKDKYYSLGTGLRYYIREWVTTTLRLDHITRDSNFKTFDYGQYLVTFTTRVEF